VLRGGYLFICNRGVLFLVEIGERADFQKQEISVEFRRQAFGVLCVKIKQS
jgi:hypothetical protein